MSKNGSFVISLDFELIWGVFDVMDLKNNSKYFLNTRETIPLILNEFANNRVRATWATVGMLFNRSWEDWEENIPSKIPKYTTEKLSSYNFGLRNKKTLSAELCFAPDIIAQIAETPGQEIGTHTYSHYYCQEPGQGLLDFKEDLYIAVQLAEQASIQLCSLVFPRNQFNSDYLTICYEFGIRNVRSNPDSWYWQNTRSDSFITKLARTGDAYLPFGRKSYKLNTFKEVSSNPHEQKASRFLRPPESNKSLNKLKMTRIKSEMLYAAENNQVYHLWWHPHNFGANPVKSMEDLKLILDYYQVLHSKYNFQSLNMADIGQSLQG